MTSWLLGLAKAQILLDNERNSYSRPLLTISCQLHHFGLRIQYSTITSNDQFTHNGKIIDKLDKINDKRSQQRKE
jgi:hypothetical protein